MSSAADNPAFQRYVAGLDDGDADGLLGALAEAAIDRTIVADALLRGLEDPDAVARLRTARRVAAMDQASPLVNASLAALAEDDIDLRVRAAAAEALQIHGEAASPPPRRRRKAAERALDAAGELLASLWLAPAQLAPRSRALRFPLVSQDPQAPRARGRVFVDDQDRLKIELKQLPGSFVGSRPTVCVRMAGGLEAIATADVAVDRAGAVTISVPPEAGPNEEVVAWLAEGVELVSERP